MPTITAAIIALLSNNLSRALANGVGTQPDKKFPAII